MGENPAIYSTFRGIDLCDALRQMDVAMIFSTYAALMICTVDYHQPNQACHAQHAQLSTRKLSSSIVYYIDGVNAL